MSDPTSSARAARESFARGLNALQTPGVPPALLACAEPIAQAMSALHRIEASGGGEMATAAPMALDAARRALAQLQAAGDAHPAVSQAMEAVASSLGVVHQLSNLAKAPAAAPAPQAHFAPAPVGLGGTHVMDRPQSAAPHTQPSPQGAAGAQQAPAGWGAPQAGHPHPPQAYQQPPQQAYQQPPQQAYQQPPQQAYQQPPQQAYQQPPQQAYQQPPQAYQQPPQQAHQQPPQAYQQPPAAPAHQSPASASGAPLAAPAGHQHVEAELGAHSATNFYKGLAGNDVVDDGGLFIATYQIHDVGTPLHIKVSMPGGYEFEALGVVSWTRDMPHSGTDSPPGYGAKFKQITPEGRQLVYRYVRNREPLFHDDL